MSTADANREAGGDVERRLSKALRLIEKLRNKYDFEKEVGQELALRNETIKKDLYNSNERHKHAMAAFDELHATFFDLWKHHEAVISSGVPTDPSALEQMREALEDQRETAERLKRFVHPPSAKLKKKSRRASEVGINIQAELGTSLTRSRPGSVVIEEAPKKTDAAAPSAVTTAVLNRKDTVTVASASKEVLVKQSVGENPDSAASRKSSMVMDGSGDLDYYSALGESQATPLFEHFIVVGVPPETAEAVLEKLKRQSELNEALSSRWLRKLGLTKMVSNDNSPASTQGRQSTNITPERTHSRDNVSSPLVEDSASHSIWNSPTNLFSGNDEGDMTSRATFSAPSTKNSPSTFSKFGKLFGSKDTGDATNADSNDTGAGSFFGLRSRRTSAPPVKPVVPEPVIDGDAVSPPLDPIASPRVARSVEVTSPAERIDDTATSATTGDQSLLATEDSKERANVFDEDDRGVSKPPLNSTTHSSSSISESKSLSSAATSALSRFGFSKKKPVGSESGAPSSFGLSFGRLSSTSLTPDESVESHSGEPPIKRLNSVEELASSFLFNDDSKPSPPPRSPKRAAPLVEFAEDLDPGIIYRYPENVAPPPVEVTDFCMPVGAKLYRVNPREEETLALKILYSHEGHRSSRCFIFMLEDRTAASGASDEDDSTARLYGICVIHQRLLCSQKNAPTGGPVFEFITPVCYCFITRFPLFDFFFQIIWSMISGERILRMQGVQDNPDDEGFDRKSYSYVPKKTLTEILFALSRTKPPMFSERVVFSVPSASTVIEHMRLTPPGDMTEHDANASSWALPVLLEWLSPRTLTWAIGLLLCEVKLIVIGHEPGMVSCAVMSLMSLLKPLTWVAPLIPILPLKHMDFIEAPVPIIAGVVMHGEAFSMTHFSGTPHHSSKPSPSPHTPTSPSPAGSSAFSEGMNDRTSTMGAVPEQYHPETENMLKKCLDKDSLTAILDLTVADIFVSKTQMKGVQDCALPGMTQFLESFASRKTLSRTASTVDASTREAPQYSVTETMREDAKIYQEMLRSHLSSFVDSVEVEYHKQLKSESLAIDAHLDAGRMRGMSTTKRPFGDEKPILESFPSFTSIDCSPNPGERSSLVYGDEFSADVEDVTQSLADAVAAALRQDSNTSLSICVDSNGEQIEGIVGVSTLAVPENEQDGRAAFLANFFQTQIFSEYMDELNLGMECLEESEDNDAITETTPSVGVRTGSITFLNDSTAISKRHSFDTSSTAVKSSPVSGHATIGHLPRPASVEYTPAGGAKSGRKGRLSMYISGGVDTITGVPVPVTEGSTVMSECSDTEVRDFSTAGTA